MDKEWNRLVKCWALGSKLLSTSFKDATTDAVIASPVGGPYCLDWHETIYSVSSPRSEIRKLIVDIAVWRWEIGAMEIQSMKDEWSHFILDVAVALEKVSDSLLHSRARSLSVKIA